VDGAANKKSLDSPSRQLAAFVFWPTKVESRPRQSDRRLAGSTEEDGHRRVCATFPMQQL